MSLQSLCCAFSMAVSVQDLQTCLPGHREACPEGHSRHKASFAPNFLTALYTGVSWAPRTWCQPSCHGKLPRCAKQWHQGAGKRGKHSPGFLRCHTNRSSPIQSMPSCLIPAVKLRAIYMGGRKTDIRHTNSEHCFTPFYRQNCAPQPM